MLTFKRISAVLTIVFLTIVSSYSETESLMQAQSGTMILDISAEDAKELIEQDSTKIVIVDIRTYGEYMNGRIEGAILVDYFKNFPDGLKELDRDNTLLLYSRTGKRSRRSLPIFRELGFKRIYHMQNGLAEWCKMGYETVR